MFEAINPASWGLSPLARGNLQARVLHPQRRGPIPARAGQPHKLIQLGLLFGAYPRSRGATGVVRQEAALFWGLSPLARGNPWLVVTASRKSRPIPARAGQPLTCFSPL